MRRGGARLSIILVFGMLFIFGPTQTFGSITSPEIEVDDFTDWSRVFTHSNSLSLATVEDDVDPTRVRSGGMPGESIVYRIDTPLRTFSVYAYYREGDDSYDSLNFYVSSDGENYVKATPSVYRDGDQITYEGRDFRWTTRYLKIEYAGSDADRALSLGKVVLNGALSVAASLSSGDVPYGSMVRLIRAHEGDTVYYTLDGSDPRFSVTRKHYSSPIEVLEETAIKTTAVNHSASGRSAASRVSAYHYVPNGALDPGGGFEDPLDTFDLTASRASVYVLGDNPSYYGGDTGRAVRTSTNPGYLIYKTDYDMSSFLVRGYHFTGYPIEEPKFFVSQDGQTYEEIAAESYTVGKAVSNWQQYAYEMDMLPAGTKYLRIQVNGSSKAWTPQISSVQINLNTASPTINTTRNDYGVKVELSSLSEGANIYYRLNEDAAFKTYVEPFQLTSYTELETYAVKNGKEPSPVRKYAVNGNADYQIDRFGQMADANFSGKVKSVDDLKADAERDAEYYGGLNPPADRDAYGGLAGSREKYGLEATGFFDIQQIGDRKVMTTPEGNLYFSLGVNVVTPVETYTMVKGREEMFEAVPSYTSVFKQAYISEGNYSFYMQNKYYKDGVFPTEHSIYQEAAERLKKWGFNSAGGYSPERYGTENNLPHTRMIPVDSMDWAKIDGIQIFDIFAPEAETVLEKAIQGAVEPYKDDPMLIGYFIGNEFEYHKFYSHVPKLKASKAAIKGRLVETLQEKYGTIEAFNSSWRTSFTSFDQVKEAELTLATSQSWRDMEAFFDYYVDTFYGTMTNLIRKYDPNHLVLGDRWITTPFHTEKFRTPLAEIAGKYFDVISINYYSYKLETDLLRDVYEKSGGKPLLMSEFGYGTSEQGLKALLPNSATNQFERGMRYRNYVEGVASLGYVVGAHLFNYVDQAGGGRYWQTYWGERYNSGLVNVADRPYKEYLEGIMDTNYDIYKVILGERPKFYYDFTKQ
ncbi:chitobiase/beta-hexosaminidase C-terminal domain-containing protein [Paenibacillus thailandensis]|uniref:Chitobiase/beta-hexosaminidase C-terminal domain-containing protein n=1 Tax=Paenibacillus thailandensis TaxID=393250 RepID=A0ABW5QYH9_9BACL